MAFDDAVQELVEARFSTNVLGVSDLPGSVSPTTCPTMAWGTRPYFAT